MTTQKKDIFRIIVVSPGDVPQERDQVPEIVDEFNRTLGEHLGVRMEVWRWETDTHPGFHLEGPQGLIDELMNIETSDLVIGTFWKRFGTPTGDARSGTEHELRRAWDLWEQHQSPQVMVYFKTAPYSPQSKAETDQWGAVLDFKAAFPKEGLWWAYEDVNAFQRLVREHITRVLLKKYNARPPEKSTPGQTVAIPDLTAHEQTYRRRPKERYEADAAYYVPLSGETTEATARPVEPQTPRSAHRRQRRAQAEYHEWLQSGQEIKRVKLANLQEGVGKYPCLILLGDPGSGRTTALENLAYQFADQPDQLPIPLRLSEFAPEMSVEDFIVQGWSGSLDANHWGCPELAANVTGYLKAGKLFFLFDALNEMPREGYKERTRALRNFVEQWHPKGNRFLVTCRVLDYGEELSGLQRVEVQPLNDDQIQQFLKLELPETWQGLWEALAKSGDDNRRLLEMARNPYQLTMMIDVFNEDGHLYQNRSGLMTRFTHILMDWAKQKCPPHDWLDADIQREALSVMAFEMQKREGSGTVVKTPLVKTVMPQQVQLAAKWPPVASPPDQVLRLGASANIIEMPVDFTSVSFYHQLLQEYFAAHQMLKRDPAGLYDLWRWPWLASEMPRWERPDGNYDPLPLPRRPDGRRRPSLRRDWRSKMMMGWFVH